MLVADLTTTLAAAFAAVAATAAWATVSTDWLRQRAQRQPNLSAGLIDVKKTGKQVIEFVNMGPGLAIQLSFALYVDGRGEAGIVGTGHLQAGERQLVRPQTPMTEKTPEFVWVCRDIDQRLHVWSNDGDHKRLRKGDYPNGRGCFAMMYPNAQLSSARDEEPPTS